MPRWQCVPIDGAEDFAIVLHSEVCLVLLQQLLQLRF
jgi:hypothetical protein